MKQLVLHKNMPKDIITPHNISLGSIVAYLKEGQVRLLQKKPFKSGYHWIDFSIHPFVITEVYDTIEEAIDSTDLNTQIYCFEDQSEFITWMKNDFK